MAAWDEREPHTAEALAHAVDLYRGGFFTDFTLRGCPEFDDWQFFQGESLAQAFVTASKKLTGMLTEQQSYEAAIPFARRAVAVDPMFETEDLQVVRAVLEEMA